MSSFVVSSNHIKHIVAFIVRNSNGVMVAGDLVWDLTNRNDVDRMGQLLWDANFNNSNRYGCDYGTFRMKRNARRMHPVQVLKLIDCLDYQCDASTAWEGSPAHKLLMKTVDLIIRELKKQHIMFAMSVNGNPDVPERKLARDYFMSVYYEAEWAI